MGKEIRELFLKRLHVELHLYKETVLQKEKAEIFAESYKIELFANLYEILAEKAETLPEELLYKLLCQRFSILEFLYRKWLKREDGFYEELREYVADELELYQAVKTAEEKEGVYGEGHDTIASGK